MSWDATLVCSACGHEVLDQNYTHNTNAMMNHVLYDGYDTTLTVAEEILGLGRGRPAETWWRQLNGLSGADGAALLNAIVTGLEADPDTYRAMNPDNGWGDYDSLLPVLRRMRDAVPEFPTHWLVSG